MRDILMAFRSSPGKVKFVLAVMGIACGAALLATGAVGWYYGNVIERINKSHDRQVSSLERQVRTEQRENRKLLRNLLDETRDLAKSQMRISDKLQVTSDTAEQAAQTAKSAASTAKGAAVNAAKAAAKSQIRIRDVVPRKGMEVDP